ncbi:MAG: GNAT family N-acetyltransferase [Chloroflexi bacterium]|nr:MAG: GNAT family N-acetyltransferase [Chloroflexota bacterium]
MTDDTASGTPSGTVWARGEGVVLRAAKAALFDGPAIRQALLDSIERGYSGDPEQLSATAECFLIESAGEVVGVLGIERGRPDSDAVAVTTLAIIRKSRGHAYAARALLVTERRLVREGARALWVRVPRGNGHGLYFVFRCGYAPVTPPPIEDGATWFRRNPALVPHLPASTPPAPPAPRPRRVDA